jgi:hypothetical protein
MWKERGKKRTVEDGAMRKNSLRMETWRKR